MRDALLKEQGAHSKAKYESKQSGYSQPNYESALVTIIHPTAVVGT